MSQKEHIFEALETREKGTDHLQMPNFDGFVQFCSKHQEIVKCFGCSKSCKKSALLCNQKCEQHKREETKHSFLSLKEFIDCVTRLKQKYVEWHEKCINEIIPDFLNTLKKKVQEFEQMLSKFSEEINLIPEFLHRCTNQKVLTLLSTPTNKWSFESLTCRDINELRYYSQHQYSLPPQITTLSFESYLKGNLSKCLEDLVWMGTPKKEFQIAGTFEEIQQSLKEMQEKVDIYGGIELAGISNQVTQNSMGVEGSRLTVQYPGEGFSRYLDNEDFQEETNLKLGSVTQQLITYLETCPHESITLLPKIELENTEFWEFLFEQFATLFKGAEIRGKFQVFDIVTVGEEELADMYCVQIFRFINYVKSKKYEELTYEITKIGRKSNLEEKKDAPVNLDEPIIVRVRGYKIAFRRNFKVNKNGYQDQ